MPQIQHLSPSDPGIIAIAKMFNIEHRRISLLQKIELANSGNLTANRFLSNERLLQSGIDRIPRELKREEENTAIKNFYYAVALAQRRLRRDDREVLFLKFLIKNNYTKDRWKNAMSEFTGIANLIADDNLEQEKHFYNYVVDKLVFLSQLKKKELDLKKLLETNDNNFDEVIDIGEIDTEVQSGDNGFKLDTNLTDRLCDLFFEAASTPFRNSINNSLD